MAAFDELLEVVVAVAKTGVLVGALTDGIGVEDLDEAIGALTAVAVGIDGAGEGLALLSEGLTSEQTALAVQRFRDEFSLDSETDVEALVEKAFKVLVPAAELVAALR